MIYGMNNASYNIRMVSHLKEIRSQGKFTETSTFPQESYYGEMKNSYVSGTISTGKQLIQHAYLRRQIRHTTCRKQLRFRDKETSRTDDTLIYVFGNGVHKFFKIKQVNNDRSFLCTRIGKRQFRPLETESENLNWSSVRVYNFRHSLIKKLFYPKMRFQVKQSVI